MQEAKHLPALIVATLALAFVLQSRFRTARGTPISIGLFEFEVLGSHPEDHRTAPDSVQRRATLEHASDNPNEASETTPFALPAGNGLALSVFL